MQMLVTLDISHNVVTSLQPLSSLQRLQHLSAAHNALPSLDGVGACAALNRLDVSSNAISSLAAVAAAAACPLLGTLTLARNPVRNVVDYRLHLVHLLPQVTSLDAVRVDEREKVHAQNLHGAEAAALKATRDALFPHGELDDGGGAVPPMAAGLLPSDGRECASGAERPENFASLDAFVDGIPASAISSGVLTFADLLRVRTANPCKRLRGHESVSRNQ